MKFSPNNKNIESRCGRCKWFDKRHIQEGEDPVLYYLPCMHPYGIGGLMMGHWDRRFNKSISGYCYEQDSKLLF